MCQNHMFYRVECVSRRFFDPSIDEQSLNEATTNLPKSMPRKGCNKYESVVRKASQNLVKTHQKAVQKRSQKRVSKKRRFTNPPAPPDKSNPPTPLPHTLSQRLRTRTVHALRYPSQRFPSSADPTGVIRL